MLQPCRTTSEAGLSHLSNTTLHCTFHSGAGASQRKLLTAMQVSTQDPAAAINPSFARAQTTGHVLCCLCGLPIAPNPTNMCVNCIRSQVDITEGIQKQVSLLWCKECARYLQPPRHWLKAEPESKELLTFCIKRIRGLSKVKLVDASFIWTEPHSRRLKVRLTVQGEVLNNAILQQSFVVEYIVDTNMCPDCNRANVNPNVWTAVVQVRQHVEHKRTFFYLEQLILKHNADAYCLNIKEIHEGVDFFFNSKAHALKFVDFLSSVVPLRFRNDKQLVSHKEHTSTYNYKYTFSTEIVPICKDDLICLPPKQVAGHGGIGPMVLCTRVTNTLTLLDPTTLRTMHLDATAFFKQPFRAWHMSRHLVEYMVLDCEPAGPSNDKFASADIQVARMADFGNNDNSLLARTHLGAVLHPGDTALGYDLATSNISDQGLQLYLDKGMSLPDVVLVRKSHQERRKRRKARGAQRAWQLKRMNMDTQELIAPTRGSKRVADPRQGDMERFMEELEEDPEMRAKVALYKNPDYSAAQEAAGQQEAMTDDEDDEGDFPEVLLDELVDDLQDMQLDEDDEAGIEAV